MGGGDILLVRTGHARRRAELGTVGHAQPKRASPHRRDVPGGAAIAVLGSDGNSDTAPSTTEGIDFPIHALTLNAMGLHLLDYLQFEDLLSRLRAGGRWEFLFVGASLRVVGGTGSPLNPIAVF